MVTAVEKIRITRSQLRELFSALRNISSAKMAFGANLDIGIPGWLVCNNAIAEGRAD
jgi:hypothetical protein